MIGSTCGRFLSKKSVINSTCDWLLASVTFAFPSGCRVKSLLFNGMPGIILLGIMKTLSIKQEDVRRSWYVIDAADKTLGRLSTQIAIRIRGKHKPEYTPHVDTGDYVVVVNADKVRVTGNKMNDKIYHHHTGYPGGIKSVSLAKLLQKKPEKVVEMAVKGMMPKNKLSRSMINKLKVYAGSDHPHAAQQPQPLEI